jgi:ubiquinone/menaquinone biosynthesis C-methylase UbiE
MRQLPFDDGSFDVVVSSLAIHNVPGAGERARALREAARVLKKGGKLAIADIRDVHAYASEREACGLKITERRDGRGTGAGPILPPVTSSTTASTTGRAETAGRLVGASIAISRPSRL